MSHKRELEYIQCCNMDESNTGYVKESDYGKLWTDYAKIEAECEMLHARVDALMLEYCPDEMTLAQLAHWGDAQKPTTTGDKP